jgi:hypothetical protein
MFPTRMRLHPGWVTAVCEKLRSLRPDADPYRYIPADLCDASPATPPAVFDSVHDSQRAFRVCAESYAFPGRHQLSTSVGTEPIKLLYDANDSVPTLYVALSDAFPSSLWLPCKASADAVHRTIDEFTFMATSHRDGHHDDLTRDLDTARKFARVQGLPDDDKGLRYAGWLARDKPFLPSMVAELHNSQELFLGETSDPEQRLEHFDLNPFLFATPLCRATVDLNATPPSVAGPGIATALYRTIYSKSLLLVQAHLGAEVKLPARDPESHEKLWRDVTTPMPPSRVGLFVRAIWPDNRRMCGGGYVVPRFNELTGCEFAADMPLDVVAAIHFAAKWAKSEVIGIRRLRERVAELASGETNGLQIGYPGTADLPSPHYTHADELGMHLQYLACMNDPTVVELLEHFATDRRAEVRMGCAKAALTAGANDIFQRIVAAEPDGRSRHYMTKLVRRRKKRDLTESEPRTIDEQFESPAPLWTRTKRIDPSSVSGKHALRRLQATGK